MKRIIAAGALGVLIAASTAQAQVNGVTADPNLTVDSFVKGMEAIKDYKTPFGAVIGFSDKTRLGAGGAKLFRVQNGRWSELSDLAAGF